MHEVHTTVVGAGIAGLAVARALTAHGLPVMVLEARDRVGGRLLSVGSDDARLDLGATWFWAAEHRVRALATELDVGVHAQYLDGDAVVQAGPDVHRLGGNPVDVPAARFTPGAQELTLAMTAAMPAGSLALARRVTEIRAVAGGLITDSAAGAVRSEHVVVAVPPALAVALIRFRPALPDALAQLARATPVWMGAVTKVVARYPTPFWRSAGLAGSAVSHVGPLREVHDMSGPDGSPAALFGFAGPVGDRTVTGAEVIAQLTKLFGPEAARPDEVLVQDWRAERFTAPPGVEHLTTYATFGHSRYGRPAMQGRLHWASTETGQDAPGHIEGALAAAERAVAAVLAADRIPSTVATTRQGEP